MSLGPILTKPGEVESARLRCDARRDGPSRSGSRVTLSPCVMRLEQPPHGTSNLKLLKGRETTYNVQHKSIHVGFGPQELIHRTQEGAKLRHVVLQVPDQEVARQHRQTNAEMLRCSSNREASFRGSRNRLEKR